MDSVAVLVQPPVVDPRLTDFDVPDSGLDCPGWLVAVADDEASVHLVHQLAVLGDMVGDLLLQSDLEELSRASLKDLGQDVAGNGDLFGLGEDRRLFHVALPSPTPGAWVSI